MKSNDKTTRREFVTRTGIVTAGVALGAPTMTAAGYNRVMGANGKVRRVFIGIGNRGSQLLNLFMMQKK